VLAEYAGRPDGGGEEGRRGTIGFDDEGFGLCLREEFRSASI
jgi:hypothetical protein